MGDQADLVAVRFDRIELQPVYDPLSHLVYVAERTDVSDVWVAGRTLLREGAPASGRGAKWLEVRELVNPSSTTDESAARGTAPDPDFSDVAKTQQTLPTTAGTGFADPHAISALWQNRLKV